MCFLTKERAEEEIVEITDKQIHEMYIYCIFAKKEYE